VAARHRIRFNRAFPSIWRNRLLLAGPKPHRARLLANQTRQIRHLGLADGRATAHQADHVAAPLGFLEIECARGRFHLVMQGFEEIGHMASMYGPSFCSLRSFWVVSVYADRRKTLILRDCCGAGALIIRSGIALLAINFHCPADIRLDPRLVGCSL
jgi:hypothetical protein